jgi:uncharacterized membrane protein YjgN (DUF898 family)
VWRGIRGTQVGSAWRYVALWWTWNILLVFTLGLTWPLRSAALMRYKLRNTVFGDHCFHSDTSGKRLYKPFLVAVVLLLGIGGLTVFFAVKLGGSALSRHEAAAPWIIGLFVFAGLLAAISTWAGYRAAELRHFTETASWGNLEFRTGIGSEGVIRVMVPNFLLTLFTLGLGLPFAQMRSLRAVARYLVIVGEQNFDEVAQNPARPPGSGEGLVAIFDGVDI